jgi:hypothetical protein
MVDIKITGQAGRTGDELVEVLAHDISGGRHEIGEDEVLQLLDPVVEYREGRNHAQDHGQQRYQREQTGVA